MSFFSLNGSLFCSSYSFFFLSFFWLPGNGELKSYFLASKLPDDVYREYVEDKDGAHVTGITFAVVALVHLSGGRISSGIIIIN